jgi:hypothetical protein
MAFEQLPAGFPIFKTAGIHIDAAAMAQKPKKEGIS